MRKSRKAATILTLLIILSLISSPAILEIFARSTAIVTVESKSGTPGRVTPIKVSVAGISEPGLSDFQGKLTYDPSVLIIERVVPLSGYNSVFASNINNDKGEARFVAAKVSGTLIREGDILQFDVKAVGNPGDGSLLELTLETFNDANGDGISHRITDGTFLVKKQKADFTFYPEKPKLGETVQFVDRSVGNIVSWLWDFGDGSGSTQQNPTHRYSKGGTYTVQLLVEDSMGVTDLISQEITVRENIPPEAKFTFSPANPEPGDTVQFTDESSDPDGTVSSWLWEFGDGGSSTAQNPTHQYTTAGTFTVKLVVKDNEGASSSAASKQIIVSGLQPPQADFSFSPINPRPRDTVQFTDRSKDPDGAIVSWTWDFGDGATSTAQTPSHKYAQAGTYTVSLTVTDSDGLSDTATKDIVVSTGKREVLVHNFPNPVGSETIFKYSLPADTESAVLRLFNITGKPVFYSELEVGDNEFKWNLESDEGKPLPNGPYFYYITAYDAQGKRIARSDIGKLVIQR